MPHSRSSPAGFTLIELVVTLTVIALVAAVAMPAMIDLTASEDAGALEPLRALLVDARRTAEVAGVTVEISLVPTSGRYRLERRALSGPAEVEEGVLPLRAVRTTPDDRFRVVFRPVGIGVGDTLRADGAVLVVDGATGRVTVLR